MDWSSVARFHRTDPIDLNLDTLSAPLSFRALEPGCVSAATTASRGVSVDGGSLEIFIKENKQGGIEPLFLETPLHALDADGYQVLLP